MTEFDSGGQSFGLSSYITLILLRSGAKTAKYVAVKTVCVIFYPTVSHLHLSCKNTLNKPAFKQLSNTNICMIALKRVLCMCWKQFGLEFSAAAAAAAAAAEAYLGDL